MKKKHIILLIIGLIIFLMPAFHSNIWFDESYSVHIVKHGFADIWNIGSHDVHPVLYYLFLKVVSLIFGYHILAFRLFSVLGMFLLSLVGYTHIRKDFGEKTGFLFSFLVCFLPVMNIYSSEIRMYGWAALFVTLTAIYAYRIIKESKNSNWILFILCSIISAYLHYYALITIGFINLYLLIYIVRKNRTLLKKWSINLAIHLVIYLPCFLVFVYQTVRVSGGFWINIKYPDVFGEILAFHFEGLFVSNLFLILAILVYAYIGYLIYKCRKEKVDIKYPLASLGIYILVIALTLYISIMVSDIFVVRYLMPMVGLTIFFIADILAKEKNKWIISCIIIVIGAISIYNTSLLVKENYSAKNNEPMEFIKNEVREDDIFIFLNIGVGSTCATNFPDNKQYFYNSQNWDVKKAYEAYKPTLECIDNLDEIAKYKGRIWVIDGDHNDMYDYLSNYEYTTIIEPNTFKTPYKNITFNISLIEMK